MPPLHHTDVDDDTTRLKYDNERVGAHAPKPFCAARPLSVDSARGGALSEVPVVPTPPKTECRLWFLLRVSTLPTEQDTLAPVAIPERALIVAAASTGCCYTDRLPSPGPPTRCGTSDKMRFPLPYSPTAAANQRQNVLPSFRPCLASTSNLRSSFKATPPSQPCWTGLQTNVSIFLLTCGVRRYWSLEPMLPRPERSLAATVSSRS